MGKTKKDTRGCACNPEFDGFREKAKEIIWIQNWQEEYLYRKSVEKRAEEQINALKSELNKLSVECTRLFNQCKSLRLQIAKYNEDVRG